MPRARRLLQGGRCRRSNIWAHAALSALPAQSRN